MYTYVWSLPINTSFIDLDHNTVLDKMHYWDQVIIKTHPLTFVVS